MDGSRGRHRIGIVAGKSSGLYGKLENCFRMRIPGVGSRHHPQTGKGIPTLAENGLRLAMHYLDVYMNRHVGIVTKNAESRLAEVLRQLATQAGKCGRGR
jgi:hypothetical protein